MKVELHQYNVCVYYYTSVSAVDSIVDFPIFEIVNCSAEYDRRSEMNVVNSQLRIPFSPAVLSHIEGFVIHVDALPDQRKHITQMDVSYF